MENNNNLLPLVSVYVITYNSAETIVETLDSIYNQTYPRIELVISDDCSKDSTVLLCRNWADAHKQRFERVAIVTTPVNKGISANVNRAWDHCQGEWVKGMAGDDTLCTDAISDYMDYLANNRHVKALFGKCSYISSDAKKIQEMYAYHDYSFFSLSLEQKLDYLIFKGCYIPCTTFIFHRKTFLQKGIRCDERIPMLDDWPLWINILKSGVDLYYFDKETVGYRISEVSMSTGTNISRLEHAHYQIFLLYLFKPIMHSGLYSYAIRRYVQSKRETTNNIFWIVLNKVLKECFGFTTAIVPPRPKII